MPNEGCGERIIGAGAKPGGGRDVYGAGMADQGLNAASIVGGRGRGALATENDGVKLAARGL